MLKNNLLAVLVAVVLATSLIPTAPAAAAPAAATPASLSPTSPCAALAHSLPVAFLGKLVRKAVNFFTGGGRLENTSGNSHELVGSCKLERKNLFLATICRTTCYSGDHVVASNDWSLCGAAIGGSF